MGTAATAPVSHATQDATLPVKRIAPVQAAKPTAKEAPREHLPPAPTLLVAGDLVVEIDAAAGRFVQKIFDQETEEMLRQWPSERQLAFARGVRAYLETLRF